MSTPMCFGTYCTYYYGRSGWPNGKIVVVPLPVVMAGSTQGPRSPDHELTLAIACCEVRAILDTTLNLRVHHCGISSDSKNARRFLYALHRFLAAQTALKRHRFALSVQGRHTETLPSPAHVLPVLGVPRMRLW